MNWDVCVKCMEFKRYKMSGIAWQFIDYPLNLPSHTHTHTVFIHLWQQFPWKLILCCYKGTPGPDVVLCVFQFDLLCRAGGDINDLYLWQHQRQS